MTQEERTAMEEAYDFLSAFVEYHIDEPPFDPEDGLTDAQRLAEYLPILQRMLSNTTPDLVQYTDHDYSELESNKKYKDYIYSQVRHARESVNPNYKYCVTSSGLHDCYLTDDISVAMEFAAKKSRDCDMWYVLKIGKLKDNTYKTFVQGVCYDGHYEERDKHAYLHFDYIAQAVGEDNIHKI